MGEGLPMQVHRLCRTNRKGTQKAWRGKAATEYSPPRRGGVARSAGVVSSAKRCCRSSIEASPCRARASRHLVCAAAVASRHFLCGAASPPLRGGECFPQDFSLRRCLSSSSFFSRRLWREISSQVKMKIMMKASVYATKRLVMGQDRVFEVLDFFFDSGDGHAPVEQVSV